MEISVPIWGEYGCRGPMIFGPGAASSVAAAAGARSRARTEAAPVIPHASLLDVSRNRLRFIEFSFRVQTAIGALIAGCGSYSLRVKSSKRKSEMFCTAGFN